MDFRLYFALLQFLWCEPKESKGLSNEEPQPEHLVEEVPQGSNEKAELPPKKAEEGKKEEDEEEEEENDKNEEEEKEDGEEEYEYDDEDEKDSENGQEKDKLSHPDRDGHAHDGEHSDAELSQEIPNTPEDKLPLLPTGKSHEKKLKENGWHFGKWWSPKSTPKLQNAPAKTIQNTPGTTKQKSSKTHPTAGGTLGQRWLSKTAMVAHIGKLTIGRPGSKHEPSLRALVTSDIMAEAGIFFKLSAKERFQDIIAQLPRQLNNVKKLTDHPVKGHSEHAPDLFSWKPIQTKFECNNKGPRNYEARKPRANPNHQNCFDPDDPEIYNNRKPKQIPW